MTFEDARAIVDRMALFPAELVSQARAVLAASDIEGDRRMAEAPAHVVVPPRATPVRFCEVAAAMELLPLAREAGAPAAVITWLEEVEQGVATC